MIFLEDKNRPRPTSRWSSRTKRSVDAGSSWKFFNCKTREMPVCTSMMQEGWAGAAAAPGSRIKCGTSGWWGEACASLWVELMTWWGRC